MMSFIRRRWQCADSSSRGGAILIWLVAVGIVFMAGMSMVFEFYIEPKPTQPAWQAIRFGILLLVAAALTAALGVAVLDDRLSWPRSMVLGAAWGTVAAVAFVASPGSRLGVWALPGLLLVLAVHRSPRAFAVACAVSFWVSALLGMVSWLFFGQRIPA